MSLDRIIHHCCLKYSRWFNRKNGRKGHLFQERYKAILVEEDSYLLELIRYIHLNPVRAGIVDRPEDYPWSSHQAYLGCTPPAWLTTEWVLSLFHSDVYQARRRLQEFVYQRIDAVEPVEFDRGVPDESRVLGSDDFVSRIRSRGARVAEGFMEPSVVIGCICKFYGLQEEELRAPGKNRYIAEARAVCITILHESAGLSFQKMSGSFMRSVSSLSDSRTRLLEKTKRDSKLAERVREAKRVLGIAPKCK
jgi:hypothetical protein